MENIHKTLVVSLVSILFATDYGVVQVYEKYTDNKKAEIVSTELKDEEHEHTEQIKMIIEFFEKRELSERKIAVAHKVKRHYREEDAD